MENCFIGAGSRVVRCVLDKRVRVEAGCAIGARGEGSPNLERPDVMSAGLSLIGKDSQIPAGFTVGRNVRWALEDPRGLAHFFPDAVVPDGSSVLP